MQKLNSKFDLVLASNVFAHNENIKQLGENLIKLLKPKGILVIEVQYLINMLEKISMIIFITNIFTIGQLIVLTNYSKDIILMYLSLKKLIHMVDH